MKLPSLDKWFNLSKHIDWYDLEQAVQQIEFYAVTEGLSLKGKSVNRTISEFKTAVREHNKKILSCRTPLMPE
jgi:hypothetical protein